MLYEVTLFGEFHGQQTVTTWNYVGDSSPAGILPSFGLANKFGVPPTGTPEVFPAGTILAAIQNLTSDQFRFVSLAVRAASDYAPTDFYEAGFKPDCTGTQPGESLSPAFAFGLRSTRTTLSIRRGFKRLPGAYEAAVADGGALVPGAITNLSAVALLMDDDLTYTASGNTIVFTPCVVQKQQYDTPKGKKAYRYYPTLAEQMNHIALRPTWAAYEFIRTQTSRQYGRGR